VTETSADEEEPYIIVVHKNGMEFIKKYKNPNE
jgi:hypothetical protein